MLFTFICMFDLAIGLLLDKKGAVGHEGFGVYVSNYREGGLVPR